MTVNQMKKKETVDELVEMPMSFDLGWFYCFKWLEWRLNERQPTALEDLRCWYFFACFFLNGQLCSNHVSMMCWPLWSMGTSFGVPCPCRIQYTPGTLLHACPSRVLFKKKNFVRHRNKRNWIPFHKTKRAFML